MEKWAIAREAYVQADKPAYWQLDSERADKERADKERADKLKA
jgi:hypothetical protein